MSRKYFLCKTNDDMVVYVDESSFNFECGHYFRGLYLCGASWCGGDCEKYRYENVRTYLSKDKYDKLLEIHHQLVGVYGLDENEEEQKRLGEIALEGKHIVSNDLASIENTKFFETIVEEEKEYLVEERGLSREDVDYLFEEYGNCKDDYQDRDILGCIYDDWDECARELAYEYGYVNKRLGDTYFDYDKFIEDLQEDEILIELPSGKIASVNF